MFLNHQYNVTFGNDDMYRNVRIDMAEFEMKTSFVIPDNISEELRQAYLTVKRRMKLK